MKNFKSIHKRPANALKLLSVATISAAMIACTNNPDGDTSYSTIDPETYEELRASLSAKEQEIARLQKEYDQKLDSAKASSSLDSYSSMLPPNAKTGECYARVWVEPQYEMISEQVLVQPQSEKISLIPAKYEWTEQRIKVEDESTRLETIPAKYETVREQILVKGERSTWRVKNSKSAAPANDKLLAAAQAAGINLSGAQPGSCYHEHYIPAEYKTVSKQIIDSQATVDIETIPAQYAWQEEQVLVSAASYRLEEVPAQFETVTETVLDKPAHTVWKKGTGPIQRIDEATGEIMCLVEVPATYKTITKKVLKSPATTRKVEIPAVYESVKVRKLVAPASQREIPVAAKTKTITTTELVSAEQFVWHEIENKQMSSKSRTGAQICLVNEPAIYKTISKQVLISPETVREIPIPAKYEMKKVKQLVSEAKERRIEIPASYQTVTQQRLISDGKMEWRSILCETNMTTGKISSIQRALKNKGYEPGPIDGVIGSQTMSAVNAYQKDNDLPVDKYLNLETLKSLGISAI